MDEKELLKLIKKAAGNRAKLIDSLLIELEKTIGNVQGMLLKKFVAEWVDKLDTDEAGKIKNTLNNKRQLSNIETVFIDFVRTDGIEIAKTLLGGIGQVTDFNGEYYKLFSKKAQLIPISNQVKTFMESWLGLKGNGWLQGNGYLHKLISDPRVLNDLRNLGMRAVTSQQGYNDLKSQLSEFIEGNKKQAGLLQKYSRNFAYDLYSQVDRATAQIYADKLAMTYAIYEGGLIKTSRKFCIAHEDKVFTRDEIAEFNPEGGIPPNYNPFVDMGGYGCRHHYSWIPKAVAVMLRPDLKNT